MRSTKPPPVRRSIPRGVGRFVAGRPIDGYYRGNSTFLRWATDDRASYWHRVPGWRRVAVRLAAIPVVFAAFVDVRWVIAAAAVAVVGILAVGVRGVSRWQHRRTVILPLARSVGFALDYGQARPEGYIDVSRAFIRGRPGSEARIRLPARTAVEAATQKRVEAGIRSVLPVSDVELVWRLSGPSPHVLIRRAPECPAKVTLADVRAQLEEVPEGTAVLGLGRGGAPVTVDFDSESPHVGISMGTGAGKSVLTRAIVAQQIRGGARVVVLDPKRVSQSWLVGLPGVEYCRSAPEMHDALIGLAVELDGRYDEVVQADVEGRPAPDFTRVIVVCEEQNILAGMLRAHWAAVKPQDGPRQSPAVEALASVVHAGRQAKMHILMIGQYLTARTTGSGEIREDLGIRILGRWSVQSWRTLAGNVPMPRSSRHRGRVHVLVDGEAHECQVLFLPEGEARGFALSGRPDPGRRPAGVGLRVVPDLEPARSAVSLSEATGPGGVLYPGVTLEAARMARKQDRRFPRPVTAQGPALMYDPDALREWTRGRVRAAAVGGA